MAHVGLKQTEMNVPTEAPLDGTWNTISAKKLNIGSKLLLSSKNIYQKKCFIKGDLLKTLHLFLREKTKRW